MGYSQLPDDDPHYTIIGRVASYWAVLEAQIDGTIAYLAGCGELEMACVTAQLIGPAKRMDALIALFVHRNGSNGLRKELKAFQGRLQQLGEERNRVVHDPLLMNEDTMQVHKFIATAKGELKYSIGPVSEDKMTAVAASIFKTGLEFVKLKKAIQLETSERLQQELERTLASRRDQNPPDENP